MNEVRGHTVADIAAMRTTLDEELRARKKAAARRR
jgi:low affinity Fe/Cu permease